MPLKRRTVFHRSKALAVALPACLWLATGTLLAPRTAVAAPEGERRLRVNLEEAVRIGAANSFALQAVGNEQQAVRELIRERWRAFLPSVGVSVNRQRTINDANTDSIRNEIRLTIEQVLYDGGRNGLNLDIARLEALLAREDFRITYNQIRLDVQRAYLRSLAAYGKILLNRKSLERARLQLRQSRLEEKLGFATEVETLTVASRVREIELAVRESINEYKQSLHDFKQLLNVDFELQITPSDNLFRDYILKPPEADVKELVFRSRSERPEIRRSLSTIHQLKKEKDIAEDAWIPRVTVGGYVGRAGEEYPVRERTWGVNFAVTFPIGPHTSSTNTALDVDREGSTRSGSTQSSVQFFEDLGYDRRVLQSKTALAEAIAQHRQLYNDVAIEVDRSYDSLREAWESIRIGNGRVYFQYASLKISETRFEVGELRRDEILEAERDLVRAQEDLVDAVANYMIAAYELEFAAALDPGSLEFFLRRRGEGNTLLKYLLDENFEAMERLRRRQEVEAQEYEIDEDRFLIDEVEID